MRVTVLRVGRENVFGLVQQLCGVEKARVEVNVHVQTNKGLEGLAYDPR